MFQDCIQIFFTEKNFCFKQEGTGEEREKLVRAASTSSSPPPSCPIANGSAGDDEEMPSCIEDKKRRQTRNGLQDHDVHVAPPSPVFTKPRTYSAGLPATAVQQVGRPSGKLFSVFSGYSSRELSYRVSCVGVRRPVLIDSVIGARAFIQAYKSRERGTSDDRGVRRRSGFFPSFILWSYWREKICNNLSSFYVFLSRYFKDFDKSLYLIYAQDLHELNHFLNNHLKCKRETLSFRFC